MAFKAGPKSKRIQELEAKLGIAATPIKPAAPLSVHLQKPEVNNSVLRPQFGISPASSSPSGVNKFDERRDKPQTATLCWHRQQKDYKVIYLSPRSSSSSLSGSPPLQSFSPSTPTQTVSIASSSTPSPSAPSARSPPPTSSPPPPPSRHATPSQFDSTPQESFNEEAESNSQVSVHRFEESPVAQEQPVRFVASPSAQEVSSEDSLLTHDVPIETSPGRPTAPAPLAKPPVAASQIPQPTKRAIAFGEGETPKERALNALKKANVAQQPSRIPSVSTSNIIISPKVSTKQIFADVESPTNKESKLRAPSKTSALRAAFEREAALINEPAKPPIVSTKKPFVMPQEKPVEASKQSEPPPSGLSDVTKSWVEGEGFATGWHTKPNKFEVHARDAAGQVVTGTKCVVEMKSRVVHAAPIQVVVRKNTEGSHMCAYVPWHEGDFTMTIYLDGRILSEKQVRVRPASERHAAEIEEAARKQEDANKRRAEEQRSRIPVPFTRRQEEEQSQSRSVSDDTPTKTSQDDFEEVERAQAQADEEARLEEQRREEIFRQEEEKREQERALQHEKELVEAEAIEREKLAYEEAARKVAEEEERQQVEHELRLLELEEARLEAEEREHAEQQQAEREAAEKELEEEFEIAKHQADLEDAEEARRIATRLREEAEAAQQQIEEEFEEAKRLADLEEMEELRQQSELELARLEHATQMEHDAQEQIDRDQAFLHGDAPSVPEVFVAVHRPDEPAADWELPSPPAAGQPEEDPLHGLDPEEAVRQAAARGRTRSPKKPEDEEGNVLHAVEESDIAQALSEAVYRAQQEVIQAEVDRIKAEEEAEARRAAAEQEENEREMKRQREEADEKQRKEAEAASSVVNIHSSPTAHTRGKEELRRQVPTKRPPPPQKRPPAPPGAASSSPKPTEAKKALSPAPAAEPTSTIMCACGESNPSNMKFCSGCGKRLAGGATHVSMHSFVESQRAAAEKARLEADPEAAEREAKEAEAERKREREREIQRAEKEASDARQWEETQRALDDAESGPVPPFVESDSVMFHVGGKAPDSPALLTRTVDPSQCWLEGEGAEVGWHTRSNKFMVHARDSEGNPVLDTQCVAEMKSVAPRVPSVSVIVHKNSEGTHTCAYLPFNEGEFMLSVSLNGQPIRDTPRKLIVKRR